MTLSKSSLYRDKRHSISKTFSWLPSPITNSAKDDRHRTSAPFLNTHMNFTAPTLTLSPSSTSSTSSPTTKKLGFFSKFKSSSTELDQILSSSDEEEEERQSPRTPRDSQQLASSSSSPIAIQSTSSSAILPTISSSPPKIASSTKTPSTDSISVQVTYKSASPLINQSPPPHPPQHASLNQYVQNVLASTFDDVDKTIEMAWDQDRRQLEIDLLTPAPFQYS